MTEKTHRLVLDCDPGIGPGLDADDSLAILLAVASPEIDVVGVSTVFGNVDVLHATDNAIRVLQSVGRTDIPVAMGMSVPLSGRLNQHSVDEFEKQRTLLEPVDMDRVQAGCDPLHAADFIIARAAEIPGELTVAAVGPLTNVAIAILKEPALKEQLRAITIMGGAFGRDVTYGRGNITPVAELNIWSDPLAAHVVFESGIPMTAAGLDVTNPDKGTVLYDDQLMALVEQKTPFTEFLYGVCKTYIDSPKFTWARNGCVLYDPVAIASIIDPSLVTTEKATVRVETTGEHTRGQTIAFPDEEGNVDVCVDVDGDAFVRLFLERLGSLVGSESSATGAPVVP